MAREMLGWGEVWAFEPQERLFYALAGNVALANLFNVHARFAAVGREVGEISIPRPDYTRPGSLGSLELNFGPRTEHIGQTVSYDSANLVPVPLVSVDSLAFSRVDFLKIDVEGMELDVLDGARTAINRDHPTILVEWIKSGKDVIRDFLVPFGYSLREAGMNLVAEFKS
jgi:FkbM family methyltransferase